MWKCDARNCCSYYRHTINMLAGSEVVEEEDKEQRREENRQDTFTSTQILRPHFSISKYFLQVRLRI